MNTYTQRQFAPLIGVSHRWLQLQAEKGTLVPTTDENGNKIYTDEHIAIFENLRTASPRLQKKSTTAEIPAAGKLSNDETPADENTAKIENTAEITQTLVEEISAPVTIDVDAKIVTLDQRADRIRKLAADVQRGIIEIGTELIAAKAEIGHGGWSDWLKENFDWTDRTAQNFMRVAERFGKSENVFGFKPSTLIQMLALPVGSEDEFIAQQADAGKHVNEMSARDVKNAVKEFNRQRDEELNTLAQKKTPPISCNKNGTVEYFTPREFVDAARRVFGGTIDLDPASSAFANETVKAEKFFSKDNDGLAQEWQGNIWLNPPYTNGVIQKFVSKLLASNFTSAIVLVDAATDTKWFGHLADACAGIVFTSGRVNCLPHGKKNSSNPTRGSAIFYIGDDAEKFFAEFEQFGFGVYPRKKNTPDNGGQKGF